MVKNPFASAGELRDAGSMPGSGGSPEGGHGNGLHCPCLENPMDRRAWQITVHGVAKSRTQLQVLSMHACGLVRSQTIPLSSFTHVNSPPSEDRRRRRPYAKVLTRLNPH